MKKISIRLLSLLLVFVCFIGICSTAVNAASTTSSKSFTGSEYGGTSKYIYVKTKDTVFKKSIKLTLSKGVLRTASDNYSLLNQYADDFKVPAAYEIKIYFWNGSNWMQESSYDVYNKTTNTVPLIRANTYYKIQVYQWRASTTLTSYINKGVVTPSRNAIIGDANWSSLPKFKAGSATRAKIYTSNPI